MENIENLWADKNFKKKEILFIVFGIYILCYIARLIEYFFIRTDQTVIGEAFIHKLFGVLVLIVALRMLHLKAGDIGFTKKHIGKDILLGLLFGLIVFAIGYIVEIVICGVKGEFLSIDFFVSSYAVDKTVFTQTSVVFILICLLGNVINVWMEEGVFRGLFQNLLERKYTFVISGLIASVLFGFWHVVSPLRDYIDGAASLHGTMANIALLVFSSGMIGFKFAMIYRIRGSLYMAMADHFVNNTIVNLLHVTTITGTDERMFLRVAVAQFLSFLIVLGFYISKKKFIMKSKNNVKVVEINSSEKVIE